ncbi:MAG: hypothetical protein KJO82_13205, partial [Gammaproteobacteria bacterium]|nr:hypothetical protein [Gammaproteobacteria bacterium]
MFLGVSARGVPHPLAIVMRLVALIESLFVARTVAREDSEKFLPIDVAELVMSTIFVLSIIFLRQRNG